jgi:Spy/CpxP family protein refolding chaperone
MKTTKILITAIFAAFLLSTASASHAAPPPDAGARMLKHMTKELSLTSEQVAAIKSIQEIHMQAMRSEIDAILTEEQRALAATLAAKRKK